MVSTTSGSIIVGHVGYKTRHLFRSVKSIKVFSSTVYTTRSSSKTSFMISYCDKTIEFVILRCTFHPKRLLGFRLRGRSSDTEISGSIHLQAWSRPHQLEN